MLHTLSILILLSSLIIQENLKCIWVEQKLFNSKSDGSRLGMCKIVVLLWNLKVTFKDKVIHPRFFVILTSSLIFFFNL